MSTESIKKLVQFEKQAKDMLEEANNKYEEMKRQAREDAKEVVKIEKENSKKKIEDLKKTVDEYIELVEKNKKEEFEEKIKSLKINDLKNKLVDELLKKICKK
ncbi:uncharacterized protein VNE69_12058 [Vairimorpha necatrix]|uniref:Uncharacterized protein n=1 Tax=Vairimorpha necatrix TaxID=6039 RepID=A0AAX4JGE7_9MICR